MLHLDALAHGLTAARAPCVRTAPWLATWLDELSIAVPEDLAAVSWLMWSLSAISARRAANVAQHALYHHLHRCGKDVRNVPSFSPSLFLAKEFLHG